MFRWLLLALSLGATTALAADKGAKDLDLGGPRRVKARLTTSDEAYRIEVSMLPVRAFDATTNTDLNRTKARLYALQALVRHLSKRRDVQFVVSGATIRNAGIDGKRYVLTLVVPQKGVALFRKDRPLPDQAMTERVSVTSSLFRARQDHENTLRQLSEQLQRRLRELAKKDRTRSEDEDAMFVKAVKALETSGLHLLDCAAGGIKDDLLLSSIPLFDKPSERDELLSLARRGKEDWRTQIRQALAAHAKRKEKSR
jgi:hypothetical protein